MTFWKKKAPAKYGNTSSLCTLGHSHRSKLESSVCGILALRQKAGELELVQVDDHVYLSRARILYVSDFKCKDSKTGDFFHVEAKGFETPEWKIKKRLWKYYGPGILEIWMGSRNPTLVETIYPTAKERE